MTDLATRTAAPLAIIPARGGSKRIPRKNVRPFRGVPLLARTIEMLRVSGRFEHIVVTTDDEDIAELARASGADVPWLRSAELADDHTATAPVVADALQRLGDLDGGSRPVCVVYPAAVFATADDLDQSFALLDRADTSYVIPVTSYPAPIQRALRRDSDGRCEMVWPEHRVTRTQDLEESFHDVGQFYWGRWDAWLAQHPLFDRRSVLHPVPRWRVQDIDTEEDWLRAELLHELLERRR